MLHLPRFALGTVQPGVDQTVLLWALTEAMRSNGLQVQNFHSRACFYHHRSTAAASGASPRLLDSWLMSPEVSRQLFIHGAETADLAVVDGKFSEAVGNVDSPGSRLEDLSEWLDLPRVVVLDVPEACASGIPARPESLDAVLLDRVSDNVQAAEWRERLETDWGVPVLGALETIEPLRAELEAVMCGCRPMNDASQLLGSFFGRLSDLERLLGLGYGRPLSGDATTFFSQPVEMPPLVVGLAFDEALDVYFPDTLDLLEARGARVVDFSPLKDERLPEGCDVVYLGCGRPERYSEELSQNHCMKLALRSHLCNGGRIYAEGGGLAYLCEHIELPDGRSKRMSGIFPAVARLNDQPGEPEAVELTLSRDTWFGPTGTAVRGYRSPTWDLQLVGSLRPSAAEEDHPKAILSGLGAIGSQVHLDFAVLPELFPRFFDPAAGSSKPDSLWSAAP